MLSGEIKFKHTACVALLGIALASQAWAVDLLDPLLTKLDTPPSVAGTMLDESNPALSCERRITSKVSLYDAVALALCNNPQTINAWIGIQQQAAQQGLVRSTYFPTVKATLQENRTHTYGYVKGNSDFATDNRSEVASETINLSWVLFDFGARQAKSENAKQLLIAAIQNHQASLLSVFANTARNYYVSIATLSNIESTLELKKAAEANLAAADARVKNGIAPISDLLQAKTQFAQSIFNLARAKGEHVASMGVLASDMGLSPSTEFTLTENRDEALGSITFVKDVAVLLEQAKKLNPLIAQAQAKLSAAQASQWANIADDLPTLSLSASASRSTRPTNYGPKLGELDSITQNRYIGFQIDIPLFTGFSSFYKARSAQAAVDTQEQQLRAAELQVSQDVWRSYQAFKTSTENLHNTETILESARLQLIAAQERYKLGVTNILELTNAQSVLADALQQRIRSLAEWRTARLQLASNIGILGVWAIQ